jgi:hypothetical protein
MGERVANQLLDVWRIAPAAILLLLILWAGHKGWWYWDAGVRRLVEQLERERDVWRTLACALLQKDGVTLPDSFMSPEGEQLVSVPRKLVSAAADLRAAYPEKTGNLEHSDPWKKSPPPEKPDT